MKRIPLLVFKIILAPLCLFAHECNPYFDPPLSNRVANYKIDLTLNHESKMIHAKQEVIWINSSPDEISELRFYMYLNSFKNTESTFIKGAGGQVFGEDIGARSAETWGWINVDSIAIRNGDDLSRNQKYIQPDDGNPLDQSVLSIDLNRPIGPGDTITLDMIFTAKMPKIIARAGYSRDDYFLFVHWFPQMGVYEKLRSGEWGWNCHQFMQNTEFYADFGVYDVSITASNRLIIGASGCRIDELDNEDGTKTLTYHVEDVIDFAWTAYPLFHEFQETWKHVNIRLLIPEEHCHMANRYITAITQSLEYLEKHVGIYPFPSISIVDPPLHALRSGLMEYPTLITVGTFSAMPRKVHNMESLAVHEFTHQYFMMMLASNEKEEAWLDEGFVTYFEDRIIDHYYGEDAGYYSFWGYKVGNQALSREEYTGMNNPRVGIIARPGWEFKEGRKELQYAKAATMLRTLERTIGQETMDKVIQSYFQKYRFTHPRGEDFITVANEVITKEHGDKFGKDLNWFFDQILYSTAVCDYEVASITNVKLSSGHGLYDTEQNTLEYKKGTRNNFYNSTVKLYRRGDMVLPVQILVTFEDGTTILEDWDGREESMFFYYEGPQRVISAHVDPEQKIYLDLDLNNNSITLEPKKAVLWKYALKAVFWVQTALESISWLI
ncbi:MAG: M1 family metallopeptidase [Bacteroidia bacterium]|nr:M1 family metallopeptidase [Bacteroidia bacterium]